MFKQVRNVIVVVVLGWLGVAAQTSIIPCPGFTRSNNINLACEIPTAVHTTSFASQNSALNNVSPTVAAQLGQLPVATASSGTGVGYSSTGDLIQITDSLGTILTQRGETIGRKHFFISFTYQRFAFDTLEGLDLKHLSTVTQLCAQQNASGACQSTSFLQAESRIDLRVDQFAGLGSFGLTNWLDATVIIPFSKVTLATGSVQHAYFSAANPNGGVSFFDSPVCPTASCSPATFNFPGSASGLGDVTATFKARISKGEKTAVAVGTEIRFPTGDANNLLGTGAYGIEPYLVVSRHSRIKVGQHSFALTPNVNLGYEWNGKSGLNVDPTTGNAQNLPADFRYSGGVDIGIKPWISVAGEFLGELVVNGPRLAEITQPVPACTSASQCPGSPVAAQPATGSCSQTASTCTFNSVTSFKGSYAMDNAGGGVKLNFHGLFLTANAMFKLDNAGLRARVVPLFGISYRFGH